MRTILSAVAVVAILAPGWVATGQDTGSPEAVARAEALQTEAIAAYKQQKYPEAVDKLRKADELLRDPKRTHPIGHSKVRPYRPRNRNVMRISAKLQSP
jgi:hypothetical protein